MAGRSRNWSIPYFDSGNCTIFNTDERQMLLALFERLPTNLSSTIKDWRTVWVVIEEKDKLTNLLEDNPKSLEKILSRYQKNKLEQENDTPAFCPICSEISLSLTLKFHLKNRKVVDLLDSSLRRHACPCCRRLLSMLLNDEKDAIDIKIGETSQYLEYPVINWLKLLITKLYEQWLCTCVLPYYLSEYYLSPVLPIGKTNEDVVEFTLNCISDDCLSIEYTVTEHENKNQLFSSGRKLFNMTTMFGMFSNTNSTAFANDTQMIQLQTKWPFKL